MCRSLSFPAACLLFLVTSVVQPADSDVVINEILYHPSGGSTGGEYLELLNTGASAVDLGGWTLSDAVTFTFPAGVTIPADEYLVVCADAASATTFYGITNVVGDWQGRLNNAGETVILKNDSGTVIAQVFYSDGSHPIGNDPWPTEADGAGPSLELFSPELDASEPQSWGIGQLYSPGAPNAPIVPGNSDIVITEIMYKPQKKRFMENLDPRNGGYWWKIGDDPAGQYVEIFNRGNAEVDLSSWSFTDGVLFTFPPGSRLRPGEYLAVCADAGYLATHYFTERAVGNFVGNLSDGGERITLVDGTGSVMDTVRYRDEPPWPIGPDQTGQALEILDPWSPGDHGNNWRGSTVPNPEEFPLEYDCDDVTAWQKVQANGRATSNRLYFYTNGAAEWLVDNIEIRPAAGGTDIMENGSFDPDDSGWQKTGNHAGTFRTTEDSFDGSGCEHIVSTGSGLSSSNSLNRTVSGLIEGQNYSVSFWVKHIRGGSLTFRLSGGGLSASASGQGCDKLLRTQSPLTFLVGTEQVLTRGTPGASNSVSSDGIPPLVHEWAHTPRRPGSGEPVVVTARVSSEDSVNSVVLQYVVLVAPFSSPDQTETVLMFDDGLSGDGAATDGVFGAMIPPQESQSLVRYRITATDVNGRSWTWPDSAEPNPNGAYFVYDGEKDTKLDAYFLIMPPESLSMLNRDPEAKRFVEATLVAEGITYDHIGLRYRSDRDRSKKSHKLRFNKQEYFRGSLSSLDTNYDWPVTEKVATNLFFLMGQTNISMEVVRLYQNGRFIGVYAARESPNRSWLRNVGWDADSEIYKSKSSDGCCSGFDPTHPNCPNGSSDFCASNLHWKSFYDSSHLPRMYIKRGDALGSFQTLQDFIFELRDTPSSQMVPYMEDNTELYDWLYKTAVHAMQPHCDYHAKNFYIVRKPEGLWDVLFFDYDRFWGCRMFGSCHSTDTDPKCSGTAFNSRVYSNSVLSRRFYRVLKDVAENLLTEDAVSAMLDQWFRDTRFDRNEERSRVAGAHVSPDSSLSRIKNGFAARRNWILNSYLPSRVTPSGNEPPKIQLEEVVEETATAPTAHTFVDDGDTWRYFKGTSAFPSGWTTVGFNDASWPSGRTGIGYGDDDDRTVLDDMQDNYIAFAARKTFHVSQSELDDIGNLALDVDYDDAFVAYLNGAEVARSGNLESAPTPVPHEHAAGDPGHEAGAFESFWIDKSLLNAGSGEDGDNVLALQVHNREIDSSDASMTALLSSTPASVDGGLTVGDGIVVDWTWTDPEGDSATVDLYWTDLGFRHFAPIPNAQDLPASSGGQGGFVWDAEIPNLEGKTFYVQAVISDGNGPMVGRSNLVAVTIAANARPLAEPETALTDQNTPVGITLTYLDDDGPGPYVFTVNQPGSGSVSGTPPNLTYTPNDGFFGQDSFVWSVHDGIGASPLATVTIDVSDVAGVNNAPVAQSKNVSTKMGDPVAITLANVDSDGPGPFEYTVQANPDNGILSGATPNLVYTPNPGFFGHDTFTYSVSDGLTNSNVATVTINVTNNLPAVAQSQDVATYKGVPISVTLSFTDADDGPGPYIYTVTDPQHGTLSGNAPGLSYRPSNNFSGQDSFTWSVHDGVDESLPATVTITVKEPNVPPLPQPKSVSTTQDQPVNIVLSFNDPDGPGPYTYAWTSPTNGDLSGTAPNLTYTPRSGFTGEDSFRYRLTDSVDISTSTAVVSIEVLPSGQNVPPVPEAKSVSTTQGEPVNIVLSFSDPDGPGPYTYAWTSPTNGDLSGTAPNLTYTPRSDFSGEDSFRYHLNDGVDASTSTAVVSIEVQPSGQTECYCDDEVGVAFSARNVGAGAGSYSDAIGVSTFDSACLNDDCSAQGTLEVIGGPGRRIEKHVYVNIISQIPSNRDQLAGWALSIKFDDNGTSSQLIDATTLGTASCDTDDCPGVGLLDGGFAQAEIVDPGRNGGQEGVVSAVVLTFNQEIVTLPPGQSTVLDIVFEVTVPQSATDLPRATFSLVDGLRGSGVPVENLATIGNSGVPYANKDTARADIVSVAGSSEEFIRADYNSNGAIEALTDSVFLLRWLFRDGTTPPCLAACDFNGDGNVQINDPIALLVWGFRGGADPVPPFPICGPSSHATDEELGCLTPPATCR